MAWLWAVRAVKLASQLSLRGGTAGDTDRPLLFYRVMSQYGNTVALMRVVLVNQLAGGVIFIATFNNNKPWKQLSSTRQPWATPSDTWSDTLVNVLFKSYRGGTPEELFVSGWIWPALSSSSISSSSTISAWMLTAPAPEGPSSQMLLWVWRMTTPPAPEGPSRSSRSSTISAWMLTAPEGLSSRTIIRTAPSPSPTTEEEEGSELLIRLHFFVTILSFKKDHFIPTFLIKVNDNDSVSFSHPTSPLSNIWQKFWWYVLLRENYKKIENYRKMLFSDNVLFC